MTTALSVYGVNIASTTLSTAATLASSSGGTTVNTSTKAGAGTNYSEIYGLGTTNSWQSAGSIGSPSGNGWLFDGTTLEGQQFVSGTWAATLKFKSNNSNSMSMSPTMRAYQRSSSGVYTLIATMTASAQSFTSSSIATFTCTATGVVASNTFATGDKLYIDVWGDITVANINSNTNILDEQSSTAGSGVASEMELETPGYQTASVTNTTYSFTDALSISDSFVSVEGGTFAVTENYALSDSFASIVNLVEAYSISDSAVFTQNSAFVEAYSLSSAVTGNETASWQDALSIADSFSSSEATPASFALSVYGADANSSTLASAGKLLTTTGGISVNVASSTANNTAWGEVYALGTGSAWASSGSIGSPSGNGWLWDASALEGQQLYSGTWTASITLKTTAGTMTAAPTIRAYKYSSGTYTLLATMTASGASIGTSETAFTCSGSSASATLFNTGEKLYLDLWLDITVANSNATASIFLVEANNATSGVSGQMEIDTPGYGAVLTNTTYNFVEAYALADSFVPSSTPNPVEALSINESVSFALSTTWSDATPIVESAQWTNGSTWQTILYVPRAFGSTVQWSQTNPADVVPVSDAFSFSAQSTWNEVAPLTDSGTYSETYSALDALSILESLQTGDNANWLDLTPLSDNGSSLTSQPLPSTNTNYTFVESLSLTESTQWITDYLSLDTTPLSESIVWSASLSLSDLLSITDAYTASADYSPVEASPLADSIVWSASLSLRDLLSITDSYSASADYNPVDALSSTDTLGWMSGYATTDSTPLADSALWSSTASQSDLLSITDTLLTSGSYTPVDALSVLSNLLTSSGVSWQDALSLTDNLILHGPVNVVMSAVESLALSSSFSVQRGTTFAEGLSIVDALTMLQRDTDVSSTLTFSTTRGTMTFVVSRGNMTLEVA